MRYVYVYHAITNHDNAGVSEREGVSVSPFICSTYRYILNTMMASSSVPSSASASSGSSSSIAWSLSSLSSLGLPEVFLTGVHSVLQQLDRAPLSPSEQSVLHSSRFLTYFIAILKKIAGEGDDNVNDGDNSDYADVDSAMVKRWINSQEKDDFMTRFLLRHLVKYTIENKCQFCKSFYADLPAEAAKRLLLPKNDGAMNPQEGRGTSAAALSTQVYGDIDFGSFFHIFQSLDITSSSRPVFVDLGHGTGKAILAALVLCGDRLEHIYGIEYVKGLYEESAKRIEEFQENHANNSYNNWNEFLVGCEASKITLIQGDFLQNLEHTVDWTTAGNCTWYVVN